MKTVSDVIEALTQGLRPVIRFQAGVADKEDYAEPNMMARIVGHRKDRDDDIVLLNFDFSEFEEHNTAFESANYFDKAGQATLTARQAGQYTPQDTMYVDLTEPLDQLFVPLEEKSTKLFALFKSENAGDSYVSWLETKLLSALAELGKNSP